ncbi:MULTISPECIES: AraC family transcriptional regulator [Lactobacillaceae]|uniref:AraC family transcriptional regulator n=1 Tax=Lactobacillaceae TaxID=33958 RepID=UPI001456B353|nr:AraC family transcriptional regulator [Lactobacillus sp. HBUAS51381]NLR10182.1 AraC family transcriptional regulator [Lactobacillus sp. HBUAS51381]
MRYSFGISDYSLPLYIDSISNRWPQEAINRKKGYPYVHWLQTISGVGKITVGGQCLELHPGQGILIDKDVSHAYHAVSGEWLTAYLTFGGELITEMLATLRFSQYIQIKNPDQQLQEFVERSYQRIKDEEVDAYQASVLVYEFLLLIKKNQIKNEVSPHLMAVIVTPILEYIKTNYMDDLKNADFVEQTHYSLQYILEVFRAYFGSSPHHLLMDYRVRKAKELLANCPDKSVEEIGKQVGFNTNSYFITAFKQREKVTPGSFRAFFK